MVCALYYVVWMYILPKLRHYHIRPEIVSVGGSAATHRLVKVPAENLALWDSTHDASGRLVGGRSEGEGVGGARVAGGKEAVFRGGRGEERGMDGWMGWRSC